MEHLWAVQRAARKAALTAATSDELSVARLDSYSADQWVAEKAFATAVPMEQCWAD
jgi:Flp pilus assembly protein TadG